jgi:hypothetical protein
MDLGRRTAEGGCPHMSSGAAGAAEAVLFQNQFKLSHHLPGRDLLGGFGVF